MGTPNETISLGEVESYLSARTDLITTTRQTGGLHKG